MTKFINDEIKHLVKHNMEHAIKAVVSNVEIADTTEEYVDYSIDFLDMLTTFDEMSENKQTSLERDFFLASIMVYRFATFVVTNVLHNYKFDDEWWDYIKDAVMEDYLD